MRTFITQDPFTYLDESKSWIERGVWPCKWICCKGAGEAPFVAAYRKRFALDKDAKIRAHVSADERYELFLDGKRIGRGSERGHMGDWYYETYDLDMPKGEHVVVARVWSMGDRAPYAQMSIRPGFMFAPEGDYMHLLGTGVAEWEAKKLGGYTFTDPSPAWGTGANLLIEGSEFDWGFEKGEGNGWQPVTALHPGANGFIRNEYPRIHLMKPATLPPMIDNEVHVGSVKFIADVYSAETRQTPVQMADSMTSELDSWNLIRGKASIEVPPHTSRRVIMDLEDYYCAYPELVTSGGKGSSVRILWAESLFVKLEGWEKGNRNEIEGKYFVGVGDTFRPDGGKERKFDTLWWQAGRYLEILVQTADEPLTIDSLKLRETHYPVQMESKFESSDDRLERVVPIAVRALQMCSHETYMDCPYYEQLMYAGDTRLEVLVTYIFSHDDRLPRKALKMFDASRLNSGLTQSRFPCRVTQIIPPFSIWWTAMVYDYALWRDDVDYVNELMPGLHNVIDRYLTYINKDGLLGAPNGWNFMDWVPDWGWGLPPDADKGVSGVVNMQFVLGLSYVSNLAEMLGEDTMAARYKKLAQELLANMDKTFWVEERGIYADDLAHKHFSEHSQCMAILSGLLSPEKHDRVAKGLLTAPDLQRTTIYFTHYLFETYKVLGKIDALFDRLGLWFDLEKLGFKTTLEMPEPSRSDCHAWATHPIYHYFASILGIRPASRGFNTVKIEPQLGPLTSAKGSLVHPKGFVEVDLKSVNGSLSGTVTLPDGVTGTFVCGGRSMDLRPGKQEVKA